MRFWAQSTLVATILFVAFVFPALAADDTTLHLASQADVKGFDPVISDDLYSNTAASQVYEGLMQYAYLERPYRVIPNLSDGMPVISPDGLTYTFKIKKGVKFADDPCFKATNGKGRDLTAEDLIYSWKRLADNKLHSSGWWIFDKHIKGLNEFYEASKGTGPTDYAMKVDGLQATDPNTLVVKLTETYPQFLYVLSMVFSSAVAREAVDAYTKEFLNHPVGTGAYVVKEWIRGSKIVFEKNPSYRGDTFPTTAEPGDKEAGLLDDAGKPCPFADRVELNIVTEDQPLWLRLMKGEFDAGGIPKDNFATAIDAKSGGLRPALLEKGLTLTKTPEPDITMTAFNMEDPILGKNAKLRKAMAFAYNNPRRIDLFYTGRALAAQSLLPPGIFGYDEKRKDPWGEYNVEKAKAMLADAGYPDGRGLPEFVSEEMADTTARQFGEMFQREMAKIGIKIKCNSNTWPEFNAKMRTKRAQIFGYAWSADYPDPENFLQLLYGPNEAPGPNSSNYKNPKYDELYNKMKNMADGPDRKKLIDEMIALFYEDAPWIMGVHRVRYGLIHKWLKNYKYHPIG
ncbi:MAG: ABC transporter substrate-binding protein, partial [Candidatus Wallbacteria bacterium]|nr:ABC transporter substrate-binding protein [Candidatus Wallbacteria bacterium]